MASGDSMQRGLADIDAPAITAKLRRFFEWRGCDSPEDLAQETLLRALRRLGEVQTNYGANPESYFLGIARNVLMEDRRKPRFEELSEEHTQDNRGRFSAPQWRVLLRECLEHLRLEDRELILLYIREGPETAASKCGITPNAARIRVSRIRDKIAALLRGPGDSR